MATRVIHKLEGYAAACRDRLLDRAKAEVDWPEVAIIGDGWEARLAKAIRTAGVSCAVFKSTKRALAAEPDFLLYADTLRMVCVHTNVAWFLVSGHEGEGALFAANCGYLPLDWDAMEMAEAA